MPTKSQRNVKCVENQIIKYLLYIIIRLIFKLKNTIMKKVILVVTLLLGIVLTGMAQDRKMKKERKMKHECTEMCKDKKHVYKHGERKHKCSKECHAMMKENQ